MRISNFLFFLLLSITPLSAQKIVVSEAIDLGRESDYYLIGQYDSLFLLLREGQTQYTVQALGDSLRPSWKKEVVFSKNSIEILGVIPDKQSFYVLYGMHQRGKTEIRLRKFAPDASELGDSSVYTFAGIINFSAFDYVLSEDRQRLLVYAVKMENRMDWAAYNLGAMKLLWGREGAFPELDFHANFEQMLINNSGEAFMILEYHNQKRKRAQHQFVVHRLKQEGSSEEFKIACREFITYSYLFQYDEKNRQLVAGGLYAENIYMAHGLFYLHYNFTDSARIYKAPFDDVLLRSMTGDKKKKLEGLEHIDVNEIILRRDGGIIMTAEQNVKYEYQLMSSYYSQPQSGRQTDYLYENVLVASFHPDGSLHWKTVLHKSQSSENDEGRYSSYFLMKTASNLRFLYNDDIKWNASMFEYELNGKGEAKRNHISDKEDTPLMPEFKKAVQVASNVLFVGSQRNNKLKIVRIEY